MGGAVIVYIDILFIVMCMYLKVPKVYLKMAFFKKCVNGKDNCLNMCRMRVCLIRILRKEGENYD